MTRLLTQLRSTAFKPGARVSDAQVLGLLIAQYLDYDANAIYEVAAAALEDANFHEAAAHVRAMVEG